MHCLGYLAAVGIIVSPVQAFAADADNGERLAQRWCAACHVVTPAQTSTTTDRAPPFPVIAKMPGFDAAKIALFLLDPHPKMPNMGCPGKRLRILQHI
jgi:mono/diheme cytochrome c family protein